MTEQLVVRYTKEDKKNIKVEAAMRGMTITELVKKAVSEYLTKNKEC